MSMPKPRSPIAGLATIAVVVGAAAGAFAYAAGWKKFEPLWDIAIKSRRLGAMTPLLEAVLSRVTQRGPAKPAPSPSPSPLLERAGTARCHDGAASHGSGRRFWSPRWR